MYSAYKLNKQADNIQPWRTPFPIWNQSIVPCPVLTVASWPAYRFLKRQVRWSGIPISWRIFHSFLWSTVKGFGIVNKAEVDVFLELSCCFDDPADVGNLVSGSSAFSVIVAKWSFTISSFLPHEIPLKGRIFPSSLFIYYQKKLACSFTLSSQFITDLHCHLCHVPGVHIFLGLFGFSLLFNDLFFSVSKQQCLTYYGFIISFSCSSVCLTKFLLQ